LVVVVGRSTADSFTVLGRNFAGDIVFDDGWEEGFEGYLETEATKRERE